MMGESSADLLGPLRRALGGARPLTPAARADQFADLYRHQFDRVHAYVRFRLADPALAEDLAAEVFTRAWAKRPDLQASDATIAWLFVTARRLVADHYRRWRPTAPLATLSPGEEPWAEPPDGQVARDDQRLRLRGLLADLSQRERDILELRFVAGLRHAGIAEIVGVSEGNVAKIMHRALRALRARLQPEEMTDDRA
jgi:RNA polymerase sigma factor (sigma-70 family)